MRKKSFRSLAIAGLCATALVTTNLNAAITVTDFPAIKPGFVWNADPTVNGWSSVNTAVGNHPDRSGVTYIFPDGATRDTWVAAGSNGIPDDAVAFIHWELDNGSGLEPGVMAITDDVPFKSHNCIMASGNTIPLEGGGSTDKTCSNPQGSSKRFKMNVLKADVPIDLVFNLEQKDLNYTNYTNPDDSIDEFFRIYRYFLKWHNATAMDSTNPAGEVRTGSRIAGYKLQLGFGLAGAFTPTLGKGTDGLEFELRTCIDDKYFDVDRAQPGPNTNDCVSGQQEIWLPNEFSTFSPAMYSLTTDKRTTPVGGYWDKNPGGIFPPASETAAEIDSGSAATTGNYFDIAANQASTAAPALAGNIFGYLMNFGVLSNNDPGTIAGGLYVDDDGDASTEGSLFAWWDGSTPTCCFRYGIDPNMNGIPNEAGENAWGIVPNDVLVYAASRPLDEHSVLPPPRFETGHLDDMAGQNSDTFILFNENMNDIGGALKQTQFTIRMIAASSAASPGADDGPWVANPLPDLADLLANVDSDGIVYIIAGGVTDPVSMTVADSDLAADATVDVVVENRRTGETETVTLDETALGAVSFSKNLPTADNATAGTNDDGTLNVQVGDVVRVTYIDADDGLGGIDVSKTDEATVLGTTVTPPPGDTPTGGGGGGGCAAGTGTAWNITMPAILLALLGYGLIRRRRRLQ